MERGRDEPVLREREGARLPHLPAGAVRIYLRASDERSHAPDGGFHRVIAVTETHYLHTDGAFDVEVPAT